MCARAGGWKKDGIASLPDRGQQIHSNARAGGEGNSLQPSRTRAVLGDPHTYTQQRKKKKRKEQVRGAGGSGARCLPVD